MSTLCVSALALLADAAEAHSLLETHTGIVVLLALALMCAGGAFTVLLMRERKTPPDAEWRRRAQAEFDAYKVRTRKEIDEAGARGREALIAEILPVVDSLDRALDARTWPDTSTATVATMDGIERVQRQLLTALEKFDVRSIEPHAEQFDPRLHEAIQVEEVRSMEPGQICEVYERGFRTGARLLRPARVSVVKRPASEAQP